MNILDARKLQKLLYKKSDCNFKTATTEVYNNKIYYIVSHRVSEQGGVQLNKQIIGRISEALDNDVKVNIGYVSKINVKHHPEGIYIKEVILIDD